MNTFNITTIRGDTYQGFSTTIFKNGSALDITGSTIRMQLKKATGDTCYITEFSTLSVGDYSITITNGLSGMFTVNSTIINIPARVYVYDGQLALSSGQVYTILHGTFEVIQDITQ